jgi:hypothetical protein
MYKEQKRERRIRDKQRMKAKARRVSRLWRSYYDGDSSRAMKHADYLAVCSCSMCGNPRRWFGERTMQEKKAGN